MSDTQLRLGFGGRERSPVLRRLAAMMAPVAQDAGSVIDGEEMLDVARAVSAAFSHQEAACGLTRAQIAERVNDACPEDRGPARRAAERVPAFGHVAVADAQEASAALHAGPGGLRRCSGVRPHRAASRSLLDRTADAIRSKNGSVEEVAEALERCRAGFAVYANRLEQLVADATLAELVAERGFDSEDRLHKTAQELQELVTDLCPQLDALAWKLVVEALRYVDAAERLLHRVLADGGLALNFDQLDPEEYLSAAREASLEDLAGVAADVVFDPARPWVDAGSVIEALEHYRPRRVRRERPPDPPVSPDADPIERIQRTAAEASKRRSLRAEALLSGEDGVELTDALRAAGRPGAGRILADLLLLDAAEDQPYGVRFSDALHVDAEAPLTYVSPATLHAERAAANDAVANDITTVAAEAA